MRVVDRMLHVLGVPHTTVTEVNLIGATSLSELNNTLRRQGRVVEALVRRSAVLNFEVESQAAVR